MEIYKLTNETIDLLSEKIGALYESVGSPKKEVLRAKLLLEEALLKYQSRMGQDVELYYRSYRLFGQYRFCVRLRTPSFDPFTLEENPMSFMLQTIMSGLENGMPTWKYRNLENEILFTVRKKTVVSGLSKILIFLVAALLLGITARVFSPQDALARFVGNYIDPLSDAYAGLFCVMAVLQTFFAIVMSIVHIGDMAAVGVIGGRIMRRFFSISFVAVTVLTLPLLPFFRLSGFGSFDLAAKSLYDIFIGFIPTDFVGPFLNYNSVHIMIIGAMFGFSLLAMGPKGSSLTEVFDECNLVSILTNNFLNKFICLYVGLKALSIVTTGNFSQLKSAGKMVGTILAGELLLLVFYTVYACAKTKLPFSKLVKIITPATVVCLSSANFGAAFNTVCESLLDAGADDDTVNISAYLGSVFFQPASTVVFVLSSLFMASAYSVPITLAWIVTAILLSVVLVWAMPNIPGAAVPVITLLYAQLGIPAEGLSLMIAINALLQFLTVSVDTWCLQSEILCLNSQNKKQTSGC